MSAGKTAVAAGGIRNATDDTEVQLTFADRYRALVEATGEIVWTNSPEGEMQGPQPGWCSYTGQSEQEVQGYGWSKAVHPADAEPTIEAWKLAVATRSVFAFEHRVRGRDGVYRWFAIRGVPIFEPDGTIREWVGVHRDIEEEKKLEASLEQSARMADAQRRIVETLFNEAPVPIALLRGPELVVEFVNPQCVAMWNRDTVKEFLGEPMLDALPELRGQGFDDLMRQVMVTGEPLVNNEVSLPIRGKDGNITPRVFNLVYSPITNEHGVVNGVGAFAFDVTMQVQARASSERLAAELAATAAERARALEQEQRARAAAEASEMAQREIMDFQERFVAVLGHDLRNPLSAIDMAVGVLRMAPATTNDPQASRVISRVSSSSRRMSRMIEQILDLTRSRIGGGLEVNSAPMDLCTLVSEIADELRTANPGRTIEVRCPSIVGSWDRDRLEQVFSNLISNAIHHGMADKPVTIDAYRDDAGQVIVDVHNDGEPIPEELRRQLFDPFRRGSRDSRSTKTAGLGLGLYISRSIVVAHGGDLEVRSSSGEGTTFRLTMPRVATNPPDDARREENINR